MQGIRVRTPAKKEFQAIKLLDKKKPIKGLHLLLMLQIFALQIQVQQIITICTFAKSNSLFQLWKISIIQLDSTITYSSISLEN
jgi:hypothetical protein